MRLQFTPAAERALATAGGWRLNGGDEVEPQTLLVGLLLEEECRAAAMLLEHGVSIDAVRARWPSLASLSHGDETAQLHSAALDDAINAALDRLSEYPRPLSLATEHLLLGLAAAPGDVSDWLAGYGLRADPIEATIHQLSGFNNEPIEVDLPVSLPAVDARTESVPIEPRPKAITGEAGDSRGVLRILDAAGNRAREAARVLEDFTRFVLDDAVKTAEFKNLRHDLAAAIGLLPVADRLAARDTPGDVGTRITNESESTRRNAGDVLSANFARLGESLRSLEEYSKLVDASVAARFEGLRYRAYALESAVVNADARARRLANARLYVLIDGGASLEAFERSARELIDAGVHVLQLRDKGLNDRELLERARRLRKMTRNTATLFVMNDRADIALLSEADGLHVGQEELGVAESRAIIGPRMLIGVSTHSLAQARQAVAEGADYIGLGPTFPSGTKTFAEFPGVAFLSEVAREISLPAFAIGGIDLSNLDAVLSTGVRRVAIGRAITSEANPGVTVAEFLARLK